MTKYSEHGLWSQADWATLGKSLYPPEPQCLWRGHKIPGVCACMLSCFSCVWLCATLWTVAHQGSLSMGFSRQAYWIGLPCPPPGDLLDPGIKHKSYFSCFGRRVFFFLTTSTTCPINLGKKYQAGQWVWLVHPATLLEDHIDIKPVLLESSSLPQTWKLRVVEHSE